MTRTTDTMSQCRHLCKGMRFSFLAGFFKEKFRLIDWRWSVWRAGGRHPQLGLSFG